MAKIVFFCIPAHGHTNPTLEVVRELVRLKHEVWYFSYAQFQSKIEAAGATFIACDPYDSQINLKAEDADRVGKDIRFSIHLMSETTLALDDMVCHTLSELNPDCVVADSMAIWGKFAAMKLNLPFISSTTTFAFNRYSSKIMKQSLGQLFNLLIAIFSVNKDVKRLRAKGYPLKNFLSMIQNDNDTDTIVYTSKEFQPCSETFSNKYTFVGPSIPKLDFVPKKKDRKQIYISLGTVNNQMLNFYNCCMEAFKASDFDVVMAIGEIIKIESLNPIPSNFTVLPFVNQLEVLSQSDVFITHCGMNSVNEALYYEVPLILYPQTAEQGGVAYRVEECKAGIRLKEESVQALREAVDCVIKDDNYKENAKRISLSFKQSGGAPKAVQAILSLIKQQ